MIPLFWTSGDVSSGLQSQSRPWFLTQEVAGSNPLTVIRRVVHINLISQKLEKGEFISNN